MRLKPAASELIGDAQFRALVLSQAIFDLGIFMRGTANSWVVLELTGSQLWIGLVAGVRAIPIMGFAFAGGAIADRFARRTLMIAGGILIASASAIVAVLIQSNTIEPWHLVVMSIAGGVGGAIYGPAFYSLIADIVRSDRLSNANGLLSVAQTTGEMLGPVIVGFVITASGAHTVFWLVVAGNAAGLLLLMRVREPERRTEKSKGSFRAQLLEGLNYAKNTPPLLWLTLLLIGQNLFAVAIFPLMPVYAEEVLEIGPTGFGLMGGFFWCRDVNWCSIREHLWCSQTTRNSHAVDGPCLGRIYGDLCVLRFGSTEHELPVRHGSHFDSVDYGRDDHVPECSYRRNAWTGHESLRDWNEHVSTRMAIWRSGGRSAWQ